MIKKEYYRWAQIIISIALFMCGDTYEIHLLKVIGCLSSLGIGISLFLMGWICEDEKC